MKKSLKVSIIIPVYKTEEFLHRCVKSAVNQTYKNIEILLVDDGSPDSCPQMCDEWAKRDNRIKVIHKINGGLSSVRNVGVKVAEGDFVMHLDSDDWLELDAIDKLVKEQIRTDADVVWGKALMHAPEGNTILDEPHYKNKHEWLLCYSKLTGNIVMTCCRRIIRRSMLIENNIHAVVGCNYAEDKVQMTQIAYYANSFSFIDDIVYHYNRLNEGSLTAQNRKKNFNTKAFCEEMGSILWIENFYADKEKVYHDEMVKAKLRLLKGKLESAIELKSPEGYVAVKRLIDDTNNLFYSEIEMDGWKNRLVYKNYYTLKTYRWIANMLYKIMHTIR